VAPRVLTSLAGPYRLFFYSNEDSEPPRAHVRRERMTAKYWLQPGRLARSRGFRAHELTEIQELIEQYEPEILEAWNDFYDS
jgi:hypothetical protein